MTSPWPGPAWPGMRRREVEGMVAVAVAVVVTMVVVMRAYMSVCLLCGMDFKVKEVIVIVHN